MKSQELCWMNAGELATAYRARELSPIEVTEQILARIEALNPALNCFLEVTPELARRQARKAEEEIRKGEIRGPLSGVPVAIKDLFFMRGFEAKAASLAYRGQIAPYDATAVARLQEAGAVIMGRTHMHELAFGVTNRNPHYGDCHNPWNTASVPGGSSGGSAAAVAAGLCCAALGTDTGGSIRIPASYCGVTGLKPTYGRVSRHGVIPLSHQLDHVGSFARSVDDAARVMAAIADAGGEDFQPAAADLRGWRLGLVGGYMAERRDPQVRSGMEAAAQAFESAGLRLEPTEIPDAFEAGEVGHLLVLVDGAASLDAHFRAHPERLGRDVRSLIEQAQSVRAVDYLNAQRYRRIFQRKLDRLFDTYRALLLAATPMAAPRMVEDAVEIDGVREDVGMASTRLVRPFNLAGVPVLTVPCGITGAGLPFGMQIVTRAGDEESGIQLGRLFQEITSWHKRRPPL
jgi:aspartyl-tRNA(Asn)/glutamyl-tRNA(Gln) amidotransferase subunit A